MNHKQDLYLMVIFGILMGGSMIGGTIWAVNSPTHIEKVKCYDRYSNEIKDLVCDEVVYESEIAESFSNGFYGFVGALFIVFSIMGLIINVHN